jgi:predicted glycosyltransferase
VDVGISFGSFLIGFVLTIMRKPNIHLSDDPERKMNAVLELMSCTERYLPPIVHPKGKTKTFNALKEWAYLSPEYFIPDSRVLEQYRLKPKEYLFIREVSTGSLNYKGQETGLVGTFAERLSKDFKVIFSLEDKLLVDRYPSDWILLKEPVNDIHSIIYYSRLVISSGDSMAREGAMLGNPGIYCGNREMKANQLLINKKMLYKVDPDKVPEFVEEICLNKIKVKDQNQFRQELLEEWDDVTLFIIKTVLKNQKQ